MMDIPDDLFPFRDRQQDPVYGFCPICGGEIYNRDSEYCFDCERSGAGGNETVPVLREFI